MNRHEITRQNVRLLAEELGVPLQTSAKCPACEDGWRWVVYTNGLEAREPCAACEGTGRLWRQP